MCGQTVGIAEYAGDKPMKGSHGANVPAYKTVRKIDPQFFNQEFTKLTFRQAAEWLAEKKEST
jgi:hypothetical protein